MDKETRKRWQKEEYMKLMGNREKEVKPEPTLRPDRDAQITEHDDGTKTFRPGDKDAILWLRHNATDDKPHQVICPSPEVVDGAIHISEPFLIAWGLYWMLERPGWKDKLVAGAKKKIEETIHEMQRKEGGET